MIFDVLVGLQFVVNLLFIARQVIDSVILKLKQKHFRYKRRKRLSQKTLKLSNDGIAAKVQVEAS